MVAVHVFDNVMDEASHRGAWAFLNGVDWRFGAYSAEGPDAERYYYKHFAGFHSSGVEAIDAAAIGDELRVNCLPFWRMWQAIRQEILPGQMLSRCYANRMPPGVGGGIHRDSPLAAHLTVIYYPHLTWSGGDGGETLFFDEAEREVVETVTPLPNRLVVFSGVIPHVARPLSPQAGHDRITLMFKTLGVGA